MQLIPKIAVAFATVVLIGAGLVAQVPAPSNPRNADAAAVQIGSGLYRERCAECHGADAKGVPGHDLTRLWTAGATDERVFQTIRAGVPNTIMPSSAAPDGELRALVSYLRSLNGPASAETASVNIDSGERLFWGTCGSCHRVNGRGGRLGPDLSRIALSQSREQLASSIRSSSASMAAGYQPVTIVTRDGQRIRGVRKSEDAFSIQIMDTRERLQGYVKGNVREVVSETRSLMPEFGADRLNDQDLDDLLRFLNTLRAAQSSRP